YARLMSAAELLQTTPRLSVATRIMTEIGRLPAPVHSDGPMRRIIRWFGRPRAVTLRLRPAWTLALAVGLGAMLLLSFQQDSTPTPGASEGIANFIGHFPGATSVEVVGVERSEEHTSELQSRGHLVCRLLLEKKKKSK